MHNDNGRILNTFTWYRMHHQKSYVERIYRSIKIGVRGRIQLAQCFESAIIIGHTKYHDTKSGVLLRTALKDKDSKEASDQKS